MFIEEHQGGGFRP